MLVLLASPTCWPASSSERGAASGTLALQELSSRKLPATFHPAEIVSGTRSVALLAVDGRHVALIDPGVQQSAKILSLGTHNVDAVGLMSRGRVVALERTRDHELEFESTGELRARRALKSAVHGSPVLYHRGHWYSVVPSHGPEGVLSVHRDGKPLVALPSSAFDVTTSVALTAAEDGAILVTDRRSPFTVALLSGGDRAKTVSVYDRSSWTPVADRQLDSLLDLRSRGAFAFRRRVVQTLVDPTSDVRFFVTSDRDGRAARVTRVDAPIALLGAVESYDLLVAMRRTPDPEVVFYSVR